MEKPYKLPKEFADKWLKALRSGEYNQSKNHLYCNGGYCCLGVATELVVGKDDFFKAINDCNLVNNSEPSDVIEYLQNINKTSIDFPFPVFTINTGTLGKILSYLNDGTSPKKDIISIFHKLNFNVKGIDEIKDDEPLKFNFEQIAEFIELNTEFYEADKGS